MKELLDMRFVLEAHSSESFKVQVKTGSFWFWKDVPDNEQFNFEMFEYRVVMADTVEDTWTPGTMHFDDDGWDNLTGGKSSYEMGEVAVNLD